MKWLHNKWKAHMDRSCEKAMVQVRLNQYLYGTGFLEKRWWGYRSIHPVHVVIWKNNPARTESTYRYEDVIRHSTKESSRWNTQIKN